MKLDRQNRLGKKVSNNYCTRYTVQYTVGDNVSRHYRKKKQTLNRKTGKTDLGENVEIKVQMK